MHYIAPLVLCCALLCGCSTPPHAQPSKLVVQIPSALGFIASTGDFRITVDGRFAGNYTPDGIVFELPAGIHRIGVELPHVYQHRELPNGGAETRTFSLRGEERIEILGGISQQTLIFNSDNLRTREVEDGGGRRHSSPTR